MGHDKAVRYLLDCGANQEAVGHDNLTAKQVALKYKHDTVAAMFE